MALDSTLALLLTLVLVVQYSLASFQIRPDNTFSTGRHYYNTLLVDQKSTSLYVGAHGNLFRLWLYNINDTSSSNLYSTRTLDVRQEEREECLRMGNSDAECDNRVRLIFVKASGQLLLCSSSGMKPQINTLDGLSLSDVEYPRTIIGICSPHEHLNTTAVYSEFGNPDDLPSVYSGIRTGLQLENHLIYRPPLVFNNKEVHSALRTVYTDSKWLNEPQFVGSFSINQYVYFFFREYAIEAETGGNSWVVYSRVARICKNDLGGKNVLRQVWTSFVKARLNCSMETFSSSGSLFYFDHIQSVFKVDQESDSLFYAAFTTAESPFQASAICVFGLNAINRVFDSGIFLEQPSAISAWLSTPPERVPNNRPGTCVSDSRLLSDEDLHFAKSHLLLADTIAGGEPLIYRRGELLTKLVVDQRDDHRAIIFALSPHRRIVHKIFHRIRSGSVGRGKLLASYQLAVDDTILAMGILPGEYLFTGEPSRVAQYRLAQCALYATCHACASDPYCSWNIARGGCFAQEAIHATSVGWITDDSQADDASTMVADKCRNYVRTVPRSAYPGDSAHLTCSTGVDDVADGVDADAPYPTWTFNNQQISPSNGRELLSVVRTAAGGIVLFNVSDAQSGIYQCLIDNVPVVEYVFRVDGADCSRPRSVEQFRAAQREWCKKYDNYKSSLSKWQDWYERNSSQCARSNSNSGVIGVSSAQSLIGAAMVGQRPPAGNNNDELPNFS